MSYLDCVNNWVLKKSLAALTAFLLVSILPTTSLAAGTTFAKGSDGQVLIASLSKGRLPLAGKTNVTVTGRGYNTKVGIYVTFCVIPEKGKKPELCGPFDITGKSNQSIWISNNPPFYGKFLVKKFGPGGTFRVSLPISSMIEDLDCTKLNCAIVTRADHTNPDYRKADVFIPVTFK